MSDPNLDRELERRVGELGYELVELERAGSTHRPILRLRIDRADATTPETGVTVEDCTRVSRALEPFLDAEAGLAPKYVLEVSSPGVERALVRNRDFERFAGQEVALAGKEPLAGRARRLEGVLLGIEGEGAESVIRLRLEKGEEISIPRGDVTRANLLFRWGSGGRRKS
jgi:ribosome maturation factor RimP